MRNLPTLNLRAGPDLTGAHLTGKDLRWSDLRGADFTDADLTHANLNYAKLSYARFIGADLRYASFRDAGLFRAHFTGDDLSRADLTGADLSYVDFSHANLCEASLSRTDLSYSNLTEADLNQAGLAGANLNTVSLRGANLSRSVMNGTQLANLDLSEVEGLETIKHGAPSSIDIETIYRSQANIPTVFLRGVGVPEPFIASMKALVIAMETIQFYSCFISYSNKDHEFTERLHTDLQTKGIRCWFAPEDLKIGDKLRPSFDEAIRVHDKLMVVLSKNSLKSQWVEKEVETAFDKEREQDRIVLFPIRLDDAVMETNQGWAADIRRTRYIGDFCDWKNHESYENAFERLLRDLEAQGKADQHRKK